MSLFLYLLSALSFAAPIDNTSMSIIAASLVQIAQSDSGISESEHQLIKNKFPFGKGTDPVFVFSLDHSTLPEQLAKLPLEKQQMEGVFHLLGLVALIDGSVSDAEYQKLQTFVSHTSYKDLQTKEPKDFLEKSQHLYNRIQHEPVLNHMKEMVAVIQRIPWSER